MLTASLLSFFIDSPVLHQLHIHHVSEGLEEFEELFLCFLYTHSWVKWEASEVEVVASHLLLVLESLQSDVGLAYLLLQSRNHVQSWLNHCNFTFLSILLLIIFVLEVVKGLPRIFMLCEADKAIAFCLSCFVVLVIFLRATSLLFFRGNALHFAADDLTEGFEHFLQ